MSKSIKPVAYVISHYLWFIVIILALSLQNTYRLPVKMPSRKCSKDNSFDENYDPDFFYHLTDVHVTHANSTTVDLLRRGFDVGAKFNSDLLLLTGDMVDSYNYPYKFKGVRITKQTPEDWKLYKKVSDEFVENYSHIYECVGNHDVPRVWSLNSDNFCFPKYSQLSKEHNVTQGVHDFQMYTKVVGNFTHIIMNPLWFPLAPVPYNYYARPTKAYLDRLELEIDLADPSKQIILSCHFQGPVWSDKKSTRGNDINAIINDERVSMFITGHNHGPKHMIMHHGNGLEICASDLRYNSKAGLVTNDNGMSIFHYIDVFSPPNFFVTYPAPVEQTTSRTKCDIGYPLVRVIAFSENAEIEASVDGKAPQKLTMERQLKKGVWLYSARLEDVPKGKHRLTVNGENTKDEFDFIYDADGETEEGIEYLWDDMLWSRHHKYFFGILYVLALFLTFPWDILLFNGYDKWIMDKDEKEHNILNWILTVLVGFIGIRARLAKLEKWVRHILHIATMFSIFVPMFTFHIDDHIEHSFFFGMILNGTFKYEPWCSFFIFYYFTLGVFPTIFACSSLGLSNALKGFSKIQIADIVVYAVAMIADYVISFVTFSLINGQIDGILSGFCTYITPWAVFIGLYIYFKWHPCKKAVAVENELLDALIDNTETVSN